MGGIVFTNGVDDTAGIFKNCEISYARKAVNVVNSNILIDSCLISMTSNCGIQVEGSSSPLIRNTLFQNIGTSPILMSLFSSPAFVNNSASNVGRMCLGVIPETYSQNAIVPIRSFGGYDNITYFLEGICTINSGTTITVPAGIVFKAINATGFNVNGRLNLLGSINNKIVFTDYRDDSEGNPQDMNQDGNTTIPPNGIGSGQTWYGTWLSLSNISNDSSTIVHTTLKYSNTAISLTSASPTIDNVRFEKDYYGVDLNGVSQPKIDNCTFFNLQYYPIQTSLVSFPASISNNIASGSTYKVIKVRDETLNQDVTLNKRSFGSIRMLSKI
jgi:hypothetical protein